MEDLQARIAHDFDYHPPSSDDIRRAHEQARDILKRTALVLTALVDKPCREQSLMLTKLEEALFWTNAAIARYHEVGSQ